MYQFNRLVARLTDRRRHASIVVHQWNYRNSMHHAGDKFRGTTLAEELDLHAIAKRGRALQNPEPELRTPTDIAYQYLRRPLRTPTG